MGTLAFVNETILVYLHYLFLSFVVPFQASMGHLQKEYRVYGIGCFRMGRFLWDPFIDECLVVSVFCTVGCSVCSVD